MIIVTGTKRSGTSMWMQILVNGGFPFIGEAFPRNWKDTILDANPQGFYESTLGGGVWWRTNPQPDTGAWLHPKTVEHHAVKIFLRGVVRTDYAYITRVIATMREWRQYESSVRRLFTIQSENTGKTFDEKKVAPLPPGFEWWLENYELIRDVATRRYAINMLSYASLLEDPEEIIGKTFQWIGKGDVKKAVSIVNTRLNTQREEHGAQFNSEFAEVFDEFYHRIHTGQGIDGAFIGKMNETTQEILKIVQELAPNYLRRRMGMALPRQPGDPDHAEIEEAESELDQEAAGAAGG